MEKETRLVKMSEIKRYQVIQKIIEGKIKQVEASRMLGLSDRQIRNIVKAVQNNGIDGIIHKSRGKPSTKKIPEETKNRIIELATTIYEGFNVSFMTEKLIEEQNIKISREKVRQILIKAGIIKSKKAKEKHRKYRERRDNKGELIQLDGSVHDWFGTGEQVWLIGMIDDADSELFARFTTSESTLAVMETTKEYLIEKGCPIALYVDKDSIYRPAIIKDEEKEYTTQFLRAMEELGIGLIYANSPQAKGRIERVFKTLQDRLVKELKLKGIKTIEEANKFLKEEYLEKHNRRFAIKPASDVDMHIKLPKKTKLNEIFCVKTERCIAKDYTVRYKGKLYQILETQKISVLTRNKVIVEEWTDNSIHLKYKDIYLNFKEITDTVKVKRKEKQQDFNGLSKKELETLKLIRQQLKIG